MAIKRADILPQVPFCPFLRQRRLEQPAAHLLSLIDQKGQHHQDGEHRAQVLLAEAKVVLKMVALVLERVEGLIFYLPAGPGPARISW